MDDYGLDLPTELFTPEQLRIMNLEVELAREDLRCWFWQAVCVLQMLYIALQAWLP